MTWPTATLGEVCDVVSGATPRTSEARFWGGDIFWTTPKDLSDLETPYLDRPARTITEDGLRSCAASLLPENSVLLSSRAPIGLVAINARPMATNQGFKSLVPDAGRLDSKYLFHWLKGKTAFLQNLGNGATFKEISKSIVSRIEIPLPPIAEQRRIAAILDKADSLLHKRKRALDLLGGLARSKFLEMFGDPLVNPKSWPRKPIGQICKVVTGNTPSRSVPSYYGSALEWIKSDNINPSELFVTEAAEYLSVQGKSVARVVPSGSILITCIAGSPTSIGNASIANREVAFNQQINALIPRQSDVVFLNYQIRLGKRLIQEASTGGMKGLVSKSRLEKVLLMCPPLDLQEKFSAYASQSAVLRERCREHLLQADALFSSLQSRAFSGQL